ncbi:MAG: DUF1080 domain-containing protein [Verrucomicrobiae bacterium]|nr:DUF1080 domain-containing protein [Verrucomicrobiae bacterium]
MKTMLPAVLIVLTACAAHKTGPTWEHWFADGKLDNFQVVSGFASYKIENGVLIGSTVEGSPNTFLATKKTYKDFELEFEVKVDEPLNSGVQVRSHIAKGGEIPEGSKSGKPLQAGRMYGPQCEISATSDRSGDFYDEARRGTWWSILTNTESIRTDAAKTAFKKGEWNHYRIVVKGDHYQSWVNGIPTADFRQPHDPEGHIGFQVHGIKKGTGPYTVRWRNVKFRELQDR